MLAFSFGYAQEVLSLLHEIYSLLIPAIMVSIWFQKQGLIIADLTTEMGLLILIISICMEISPFEDMNFGIGLDVNSFSLTNLGLTENQIDLSYIYKIPVNFDTYILGALSLGIGSQDIDKSSLIFQDQIDLTLGYNFWGFQRSIG